MARSDAILQRLSALHPKLIDLSLDRMHRVLAALDHPERRLPPVIHVAGTNGKGSTVAFLRAMLEAAGLSVHVYTSPHLVRFHERVRLGAPDGGRLVDEAALSAALERAEEVNGGAPITIFEITTAAALDLFAAHPADVLLLEVGLGGRLDATNVVDTPLVTAITPVSHDHADFLGDDLAGIAGEKAGIIKPDVPCVVAAQEDAALDTILETCVQRGALALVSGREWQAHEERGRLVFENADGLLDLPAPRLPGRHQRENAGTAIAAVRASGLAVGEAHIAEGLQGVEWPARMQSITSGPVFDLAPTGAEIWLDGGHNASAGIALAEQMAEFEDRAPRPLVLIAAMLRSKQAHDFLAPFAGLASEVLAVPVPDEPASLTADELAAQAEAAGLPARAMPDIESAMAAIDSAIPPRVLICGSLYFAGHVLGLQDAALA